MAEEKTLVEILEDNSPIDIVKYINFVRAPQCGAIATFSGTTRDTFDGKTVVELRYEAYVPMAIRIIKSICSKAQEMWNLNLIAVAHQLGRVPVGETSVFVAISSVHRVDALDACKYVIDELKASVPIWKKEVYSNGEVWKENSEFMERRSVLGIDNEGSHKNVKVETHVKMGCCASKVRVDQEITGGLLEAEAEADNRKKGCCGPKVRVSETIEGDSKQSSMSREDGE